MNDFLDNFRGTFAAPEPSRLFGIAPATDRGDFDLDTMSALMRDFEKEQEEFERQQRETLSQVQCDVCKVRVKIDGRGLNATLIVCGHILAALKEKAPPHVVGPLDRLCGLRVVTPREWIAEEATKAITDMVFKPSKELWSQP